MYYAYRVLGRARVRTRSGVKYNKKKSYGGKSIKRNKMECELTLGLNKRVL